MRRAGALAGLASSVTLLVGGDPRGAEERGEPLLRTVEAFLEADDWHFKRVEGGTIFRMGFKGKAGSWFCFAQTRERQEQFLFYSVPQAKVPEAVRPAVAEYITRANYGLAIGNFEMDFRDGEVRYKTSIDVEGGKLTHMMIKNLIYANVLTTDKYLPGLKKVMRGEAKPVEAIREIENPPAPRSATGGATRPRGRIGAPPPAVGPAFAGAGRA